MEAALLAEEFATRALDESLLAEFHARICGDLAPDWAGKWRAVEVAVGPLTPPSPHQLPMLMRDYGLDLQARWEEASANDIELTLEFLAFAEGRFLSIHPFRDFNGRTIRVFLVELLRRLDLPRVELAPPTDAGRTHYFAVLEAADRHDLAPLVAIWRERLANAEIRQPSTQEPPDDATARVREDSASEWGEVPPLTAEQRALVDELVKDGLEIQHKFRPEPLYRQTGKGHYEGNTVEEIRHAKERTSGKPPQP